MKIQIDISSFSFRFIGIWLAILSVFIFLLSSKILCILLLGLAIVIYSRKYKYLIPNTSENVSAKIAKTLQFIGLSYQHTRTGFSTKMVNINIFNYRFFTILHFTFDKMYNEQGKYLSETIVKYQRYP